MGKSIVLSQPTWCEVWGFSVLESHFFSLIKDRIIYEGGMVGFY